MVYATDGNEELLKLLLHNIDANLKDVPEVRARIRVVHHLWCVGHEQLLLLLLLCADTDSWLGYLLEHMLSTARGSFGEPEVDPMAAVGDVALVFGADIAACPYVLAVLPQPRKSNRAAFDNTRSVRFCCRCGSHTATPPLCRRSLHHARDCVLWMEQL